MPNPNPVKQPSIEDEGLENYLERTKDEHNGYGFEEFKKRLELGEFKTIIAKAFNIKTTRTIKKWINIYKKEAKQWRK